MDKAEILRRAYLALQLNGIVRSRKDFAKDLEYNYTCLSGAFNGSERYLTTRFFERIGRCYPMLNKEFLRTGEGEVMANMDGDMVDIVDNGAKGFVEIVDGRKVFSCVDGDPFDGGEDACEPPTEASDAQYRYSPRAMEMLIEELKAQRELTSKAQVQTDKAMAQIDKLVEIIKDISIRKA